MPLAPSFDMGKDPFSQKETDVNSHLIACNYYLLQVKGRHLWVASGLVME